jgi:DNA ligase D-like protein (predicted ligase)
MYRPMLAAPGSKQDLVRLGFLYEPKLDGTRAICYLESKVRFINRRDRDISARYPELLAALSAHPQQCVLDGEIVVFGEDGNPSFHLLQKREQAAPQMYHLRSRQHPATYVVFDILMLGGKDLTGLGLRERRSILEEALEDGERVRKIVQTEKGTKLWELVVAKGTEGVMAKDAESVYEQGVRSRHWLKIKTTATVDCVIVGYTHESRNISALMLALYDGGELVFIGRVGTGFTEEFLAVLKKSLDKIEVDQPSIPTTSSIEVTWVRPEMVCEVEYLEVTMNRHLRAPVFRRLRAEKAPEECTMDQLE